jgi:3-oxoacyl-[acyl-carrier protein] reductase
MPLSSNLLKSRVLVTGASQGIGFAAAKAFLEEGARVVINSSNKQRLEKAKNQLSQLGEVHAVVADLREKTEIDRLVSETKRLLGGIETLVYVTGSPKPGTFMEKEYDDWLDAAKLLTISPAYLARRVAELMLERSVKGRIVLLASFAIKEPIPNIALSNVCRIAIAGIVRTLARELGPKGIRVNAILPGYIKTSRIDQVAQDLARRWGVTVDEAFSKIAQEIPLGYIAPPEELARSIIFLGSDLSTYVNGAVLPVDGGLLRSVF